MASVKVAVRVRPFNKRELDMNAASIIEMEGKKTRICNSKLTHVTKQEGDASREKYKDFTFDYSYWSYDSKDPHFASQEQVFKDLGMDVVGNAFQGYNACVFAYGQTGSGKTHTMMGSQTPLEDQGLIPRICLDMFNRMSEGKANGTTYSTEVSYLEIYNERVKDLLTRDQTHSLRVREHPRHGPYVEELSKHLVTNYAGIQDVMNRGNANRTTASTNMNDVSSRSHAIFTMTFSQASFVDGLPAETVSKIHLVDLAGSERADASGATGKRLKEGAHINKSLVTLGSVISALAEFSQAQQNKNNSHKTFIPYRDSVLTWLLKDSLGGNAKTIMIATISPADCNYGETLSTLRYANRAKNIINKPTINEDPNVKLIRELRAEIDKLKLKLGSNDDNVVARPEVLEELHKKEAKEKSLTEEWTEKWKETQKILMEQKDLALRKAGTGVVLDSQMPHLIGIDDDLLSTGITLYHLKEGETKIGSEEEGNNKHDILLKGLGLESQHCSIMLESGVATLVPFNGALCSVNGQPIDKPTRLFQGCVILIGRTSMFRYNDPAEAEKLRREGSTSNTNLNQSRLSFLSRSVTDLSEYLNSTAIGEENTALEEKRKQLEAEETRLQKESQELLQQKKLLEEQKFTYQQLQQQKEEAWKAEQLNKSADIQLAQKELEVRKHKLENEYAAHRRRLAEDWKRLEQQEQDTLASLQSKEADLKKRRELLEWEVDEEMKQIEAEAVRVEALKTTYEKQEQDVAKRVNVLNDELQERLGRPNEDLRPILLMEEVQFQAYLDEQARKVEDWRNTTMASLAKRKDGLSEKLKAVTSQIDECTDPVRLKELETERQALKDNENKVVEDTISAESEYKSSKSKLKDSEDILQNYRTKFADLNKGLLELNNEIEQGISRMVASQNKIERTESDLELITGQEKLIVSQLAHINSSKQKLLTIIEHSTEGYDVDQSDFERAVPGETLADEMINRREKNSGNPSVESSPIQPSKGNHMQVNDLSPIKSNGTANMNDQSELILSAAPSPRPSIMKLSDEEAEMELKRLIVQINNQKSVVLECLENDCEGTQELDIQMTLLQDLRSRYLELESHYGEKQRWFGYEDDDSTYSFYKNGDTTPGGDSELDESEALSSVTDTEDHIQMLVDQGVEKRLQEIFEQLKAGKHPSFLLDSNLSRRNFRRSMPGGLNNRAGSAGSDEESGFPNTGLGLPRSVSMGSGIWSALHQGEGVIPGVLDICILNYMLRGAGYNTHYDYEILIITPTEKWSILRRFSRIRDLYKYMKSRYGSKVAKISFPRRELIPFSRKSEAIARIRKPLLETFFKNLIQVCREIPTCPLHHCDSTNIKASLIAFSPFFEKGIFESTKHGTT